MKTIKGKAPNLYEVTTDLKRRTIGFSIAEGPALVGMSRDQAMDIVYGVQDAIARLDASRLLYGSSGTQKLPKSIESLPGEIKKFEDHGRGWTSTSILHKDEG